FNPKTDNGVVDPLTIPSLRGAHLMAPYGHDGRTLSMTVFTRTLVDSEFAVTEPSRAILDAVVAYIDDIDFVSNPRLGTGGRLAGAAWGGGGRGGGLVRRS